MKPKELWENIRPIFIKYENDLYNLEKTLASKCIQIDDKATIHENPICSFSKISINLEDKSKKGRFYFTYRDGKDRKDIIFNNSDPEKYYDFKFSIPIGLGKIKKLLGNLEFDGIAIGNNKIDERGYWCYIQDENPKLRECNISSLDNIVKKQFLLASILGEGMIPLESILKWGGTSFKELQSLPPIHPDIISILEKRTSENMPYATLKFSKKITGYKPWPNDEVSANITYDTKGYHNLNVKIPARKETLTLIDKVIEI